MSSRNVTAPEYVLSCDAPGGCTAEVYSVDWDSRGPRLRAEAASIGWKVRPLSGKGSRTAPDLCPQHADGTTNG